MRPEILNPLFAEAEVLKGVGPGLAKALKRIGLTRVVDLLFHLPTGAIERVRARGIGHELVGRIVIVEVTPFETRPAQGRAPYRVFASDADGNTLTLVYFNNPGWAKKSLPLGEARLVSGKACALPKKIQAFVGCLALAPALRCSRTELATLGR